MNDISANQAGDRNQFIQIWRGIAVFIVVYYHFTNRVPASALNMDGPPTIVFHAGKLGVLIFFVISGYLIAKSLARSPDLAHFYAKRVSRIWPLFILASIVIFAFLHWVEPPIVESGPKKFFSEPRQFTDLVGSVFFLEDIGFHWMDGVFWSVLVELKFYFWIGILAWLRPKNFASDFALLAMVIAGAELMLSHNAAFAVVTKVLNGLFIAQYLPFFAIGALLAIHQNQKLLSPLLLLALVQAVAKSAANPDFDIQQTAGFGLLLAMVVFADTALFKARIFLHIGQYSYGFYLFHQMIGLSVIKALGGILSYDTALIIALLATYALSIVASEIAEWHFRLIFIRQLTKIFRILGLERMSLTTGHEAQPDNVR